MAAGLAAAIPMSPFAIERLYATGIYPALQRTLTPVSNVVPFAVLDVLALCALVLLAAATVRAARRARRTRRLGPAVHLSFVLLVAAASVYLAFLVLWGLNYRRVPMQERLMVDSRPVTSEAVVELGREAVHQVNRLHAQAHQAGWGARTWRDRPLRAAFASTQRLLSDAPAAVPGRLKWSVLGLYFRWAGIDGMVNPFALEVLANPDLLPWERPFVAAHEWAHLAGYAHEAEANFVGWLTCLRGDDASQYSGWLYLYWQIAGEVSGENAAELSGALEPGPRADVEAIIARLQRGQLPFLRRASWAMYDHYLRANRVDEGVRSYGEVVNLILRARFESGWTPVRRDGGPLSP